MIDKAPYFIQRACTEGEHEIVETDGRQYCRVCKFTVESLDSVIGHEV